jgi:hypothetical protein
MLSNRLYLLSGKRFRRMKTFDLMEAPMISHVQSSTPATYRRLPYLLI